MSLVALLASALLTQNAPGAPAAPANPSAGLAAAPAREAVVVVSVENMYSGPNDAADVVSQAMLGQTVGVLEVWGAFVRVRTPDAYEGWLPATAIVPCPGAAAARYARSGRVVEVTSLMANVYRDPDVTSAAAARPRAARDAPRRRGRRAERAVARLAPARTGRRAMCSGAT